MSRSRRQFIAPLVALALGVATQWASPARATCTATAGTPESPADGSTVTCDTLPDLFATGIGTHHPGDGVTVNVQTGAAIDALLHDLATALLHHGGDAGPGISLGDSGTVVNQGLVAGSGAVALSFATGTNLLTLSTGSTFFGDLQGGTGTDSVFLEGTGAEANDFLDFENLTMRGVTWTLSGTSSITTTTVESGFLHIDGALTSSVGVDLGGTLGGVGTITGLVTNGGTLAPGGFYYVQSALQGERRQLFWDLFFTEDIHELDLGDLIHRFGDLFFPHDIVELAPGGSIGVTTVDGAYVQTALGTLLIESDGAGNADLLAVIGAPGYATLAGTLLVDASPGVDSINTVLTAAGGMSGSFDAVTSSNRIAATASTGAGAVVMATVSPAGLDSRVDAALDNSFLFLSSLSGRLHRSRAEGSPGTQTASTRWWVGDAGSGLGAFSGPNTPVEGGGLGAARGVGWWGSRDRQQGVLGYDYTLAGFVAGFDTSLGKTGWTLGGAFSYTRANMEVDRSVSRSDADNFLLGAYAGYDRGPFFADVALGGGVSDYDTLRDVEIGGVRATAKAGFDGSTVAIRGLAGMEIDMGYGLVVRPLVGIDYAWVHQDSFTEKNAGVGNLSLKSDGAQALRISGGLVYSRPFAFEIRGRKARLVPEIRTGLVGQLVLGNRNVAASLPGLGGAFTLRGNESAAVRGAVGAGVSLWLEKRLAIFVDYAGEYGTNTRNMRLVGGVRFTL